ncbi:MAG TPA: serine/threonine protein kinase [candidate division Zixibacteria bacterium]|nr:serine/threonine protein kinase [candidate division Zixibacteria bacterium]
MGRNDFSFDLPEGRTLGSNYHVVEFLGGGWEGEVYKVRERHTGIIRAAKIFYPYHISRKPLLKYARKLYKLRTCPILIQYHHRGEAKISGKRVEFLVSDLAEGELLSTFIKRQRGRKLTQFQAMHLLYALARGIEQIHFLGQYHGDIHTDNIMVKRKGLGFNVRLIDLFDLGRSNRERIQQDVFDLLTVFYEMIGGAEGYKRADDNVRKLIMGRKHSLIRQHFNTAGDIRLALENLEW